MEMEDNIVSQTPRESQQICQEEGSAAVSIIPNDLGNTDLQTPSQPENV